MAMCNSGIQETEAGSLELAGHLGWMKHRETVLQYISCRVIEEDMQPPHTRAHLWAYRQTCGNMHIRMCKPCTEKGVEFGRVKENQVGEKSPGVLALFQRLGEQQPRPPL